MSTVKMTGSEVTWRRVLGKHVRVSLSSGLLWAGPSWANTLEWVSRVTPDCGSHVTSCFTLLLPRLPTVTDCPTVSRRRPSSLLCFFRGLHHSTREKSLLVQLPVAGLSPQTQWPMPSKVLRLWMWKSDASPQGSLLLLPRPQQVSQR